MTAADPTTALSTYDTVERQIFLRAVLSGVDLGAAAAQIASLITDVYFTAGTVIYREGESTDHLYFVVEGTVSLTREGEEPWLMQERSVIGALDAALDQPHARTAVAVDDVHVMLLAIEDWQDILEDHSDLAQAMVLRNARGLHEMCLRLAPSGGFAEPPPPDSDPEGPASSTTPGELDPVDRLVILTEAGLFQRAGIQPLLTLATTARTRRLEAGEVLFEQGQRVTELYLVARGLIDIEREDPVLRARFGPGALVAGPPALANVERAFTARAATDAVVLVVRRDELLDVMEDHFAALRSVLAYLAVERDRMQRLEAEFRASRDRH
ncbi:MAG: cyclic nucleotide-binding domain-containing protein [Deltaproteobacteria bacterium]|jgi:CRP-like cAMP-binding protein|nr:cyclic nucleotide-binding domain-containing protein [Deltaproteobacteria bacterium]MBW2529877.1 cyclic nucleotide-binding domain-containing protein [Deltaproteobacteria bacterium]